MQIVGERTLEQYGYIPISRFVFIRDIALGITVMVNNELL